jgi:hypothetical protein
MLDFGGIRIEDNLITDDGHEVITADVPLLGWPRVDTTGRDGILAR